MWSFRRVSAFGGYLAMLLAAGCSGGGGGGGSMPTATPPPPVVVTRTFPSGDATAAGGGTAWDIVGVKTTLTGQFASGGGNLYDTLRVDVTFAQDVSNALPAPGQPLSGLGQLGVSIALDTDGNPSSGIFKTCNASSEITPFEYESDQGNDPSRLADGNYSIVGPSGPIYSGPANPSAEAQISINYNVLSETFFLASINVFASKSVPKIGVSIAAGNGSGQGITDCVPFTTSEIFTDGS
jgi:hypothetical protein